MDERLHLEVGPGWKDLVTECHEKLLKIDKNYKPVQVKEKFGGLRFYFDSSFGHKSMQANAMNKIVFEYEQKSYKICETCGAPGEPRRNYGWIKTACDEHAKK
jgi:hypothetical protein